MKKSYMPDGWGHLWFSLQAAWHVGYNVAFVNDEQVLYTAMSSAQDQPGCAWEDKVYLGVGRVAMTGCRFKYDVLTSWFNTPDGRAAALDALAASHLAEYGARADVPRHPDLDDDAKPDVVVIG